MPVGHALSAAVDVLLIVAIWAVVWAMVRER